MYYTIRKENKMERYALQNLLKWKENPSKKPLVIQGARQVGKTWLLKEFGKNYYQKVVYVNFDNNEKMDNLFSGDMDIEHIISGLEVYSQIKIIPNDTLIIFDEIQENPNALNSLKYFYENAPEYQIVSAGSLLGVALTHQGKSFPVGKVEFMDLYPMSFCEFLTAIGEEKLCELLRKLDFNLIKVFKSKYEELLKKYLYIGGMPEVVKNYVENKDFIKVRELQKQLLKAYEEDFGKHIAKKDTPKVQMIWDSIPSQLAKRNPKFIYRLLKEGARAKEFEDALIWLKKTGLVYQVNKLTKPDLPIFSYEDRSSFKLYMLDTGLFCAKSLLDVETLLDGSRIFEEFRASLTEQYVLQELKTLPEMPITYWEGKNSEVDFVIQHKNGVVPVEVKATTNLKAKSLKAYCDKYTPEKAVRTSLSDYKKTDHLFDIPLYCIENVNTILE